MQLTIPVSMLDSDPDLNVIFQMVKECGFVTQNLVYSKLATNTKLTLDKADFTFNAYAISYAEDSHEIHFYGGLLNAFKVISLALAKFENDKDIKCLRNVCQLIGSDLVNGVEFTNNQINKSIDDLGLRDADESIKISTEAKSYWTGHMLFVMAHELGHICLGHTLSSDEQWSPSVSRNYERQADLFANSVVLLTPFAKYTNLASLFVPILFTWVHGEHDEDVTSHPSGRERVYNTLEANREILSEYGFTRKNIDQFLP